MKQFLSLRKFFLSLSLAGGALALSAGLATAAEFTAGDLTIVNPQAAPTVAVMKVGGVFFESVVNSGSTPDRLLGARSPVSDTVELHHMTMQDGVMRMRPIDGVEISKDQPVNFQRGKPDTYHIMLFDLKNPLEAGSTFPLTLQFEKAGDVEVTVSVMQGAGGYGHAK